MVIMCDLTWQMLGRIRYCLDNLVWEYNFVVSIPSFVYSYHYHNHLVWHVNILICMTRLSYRHFIYMAALFFIIKSSKLKKNMSIWNSELDSLAYMWLYFQLIFSLCVLLYHCKCSLTLLCFCINTSKPARARTSLKFSNTCISNYVYY
jgi:hypothetical protein